MGNSQSDQAPCTPDQAPSTPDQAPSTPDQAFSTPVNNDVANDGGDEEEIAVSLKDQAPTNVGETFDQNHTATQSGEEYIKFLPLEGKGSFAYDDFRGSKFRWATVEVDNQTRSLPKNRYKDWNGTSIKFSIMGGKVAQHIHLEAIIEDGSKAEPVHTAYVEFYMGATYSTTGQVKNLTWKVVELDGEPIDRSIRVEFDTGGAVTCGLHVRDKGWNKNTIETLEALAQYKLPGHVSLRLKTTGAQDEYETLEMLQTMPKDDAKPHRRLAWGPYLRKSGKVEANFGAMIPRAEFKRIGHEPIRYPAKDYFMDPMEAELKLCYGAKLESDFELDLILKLHAGNHEAGFVVVSSDVVVAQMKIDYQAFESSDQLQIREGIWFEITWRPQGVDRPQTCTAVTVDNAYGFNTTNLLLLVTGRSAEKFKDMSCAYGQIPVYYPATLKAKSTDATAKSMVSAVHELCNPGEQGSAQKWWPVLLNQDASQAKKVDPTAFLEKPKSEIDGVMNGILKDKNFKWNDRQQQCIKQSRILTGHVGLISGSAGVGKTVTIAAITAFYVRCGMHVLLCGPTHSATSQLAKKILEFDTSLKPLRVYRSIHEATAVLRGTDDNDDSEHVTDSEIDQAVAVDLALLRRVKQDYRRRYFGIPSISVSHTCIDRAMAADPGDTLMMAYPVEEANNLTDIDRNNVPQSQIDMWAEFRRFLAKFDEDIPFGKWEDNDKKQFKACFRYIRQKVMQDARVVVTTTMNTTSDDLRQYFGSTGKGIVVIQDEAAMLQEPATWVPIMKLTHRSKIQGFIMVGDVKQIRPSILSLNAGTNEFADQMKLSLFDRLIHQRFPSIRLNVQFRMHPDIAKPVNDWIYGGQLLNDRSTSERPLPANFPGFFQEYTGDEDQSRAHLYLINVESGECIRNPATTSRYNKQNAVVVMDLLLSIRAKDAFPLSDITILVPYADQRRLYSILMTNAAKEGGFSVDEWPPIETVDNYQGQDKRFVILDLVITSGDALGFMVDEGRMNVATTRAKEVFWVVGNKEMSYAVRFENWKPTKKNNRGLEVPNPMPYVIEYVKQLYLVSRYVMKDRDASAVKFPRHTAVIEEIPDDSDAPSDAAAGMPSATDTAQDDSINWDNAGSAPVAIPQVPAR
ncbi:MAG: hypothetical protein M1830_010359 [Pleopsidium flavum]|nr:MAG: hypothetical protein M1830_010359 [Pleopsidium flavum]